MMKSAWGVDLGIASLHMRLDWKEQDKDSFRRRRLNPTSSVCCQRYCSIRCRLSLYHQTRSVSFVFIIYIFLTGLRRADMFLFGLSMFFLTPIVWYLQVLCVKLLNRRTEQENSNNITNFISRRTEERPSDDGKTSSHLPLRRCGFW